jgi:hypothetical protein
MRKATEIILRRFVDDLTRLYSDNLVSVVLYGSAVAGEYIEGKSNINCLVLLRKVTPQSLRLSTKELSRWRRKGIVTPLFLDPAYVKIACDVFPIEFLDIKERYRLLHGEDFLRGLNISAANVAFQSEQEIKAKLLRLRQLYLEGADSRRGIRALLLGSLSSFLALFRALLRSRGIPPPFGPAAILDQMNRLGVTLDAFATVVRLKRSDKLMTKSHVHELFARYLGEISAVIDFIEQEKRRGDPP